MRLPGYDDAVTTILEAIAPVATETVPTGQALGRVLAAPLVVPADMPRGHRSAMDGYAVGDCERRQFTVVGEAAAGSGPHRALQPHQAVAIMTGALVPEGAVAVVKIERTTRDGDQVSVSGNMAPGDLINPAGSEATRGAPLLEAGRRLDLPAHAAIMSTGLATVPVHRRPRVGVAITGDEVRQAGQDTTEGCVFDANSALVRAMAEALGCDVATTAHVPDDEAATRAALDELAANCDVVVTSGGVSKGRYDHVGKVLRGAPERLLLGGTAIKPGRPMHVARLAGSVPVFAMPGYPTSMLVNAFLYLAPALRVLAGRHDAATTWMHATLDGNLRHRPGRQDFARVALWVHEGSWRARSSGSQTTSHFLSTTQAQGLARLPDGEPAVSPAGTVVPVLHFGLELT